MGRAGHWPSDWLLTARFGCALKNRVGGGDWRLWRLDNRIAAAFGEDAPGFTEVHFVEFFGWDPHGAPFVDLGLAAPACPAGRPLPGRARCLVLPCPVPVLLCPVSLPASALSPALGRVSQHKLARQAAPAVSSQQPFAGQEGEVAVAERIRVNGTSFSVEAAGKGSPVVLIHGWSMSGRFFQRQLAELPMAHQVIVPDLRGHGQSEKVLHGHTVPSYARDLRAILDEFGVHRPVLVGWSMGAMVAYEFIRLLGPGSVAGLVVVDQPPSDFAWEGYEFGVFTLEGLRDTIEQLQVDQEAVVAEFARLMLHKPDEEAIAWMTAEILQVPPVIASTILADQTLRDYRDLLPQLAVPTLVAFGEDDKLTSPRAGEYIAQRIPEARLVTFAESSHCPFWEESGAFNQAVIEFAASV